MARDRTARTRVRQLLTSHGPVTDLSGYASSALKDAVRYQGSSVAFIQLIASMERDGEIVREIRGKRTYQISASPAIVANQSGDGPHGVISKAAVSPVAGIADRPASQLDYDELARALVRELIAMIRTSGNSTATPPARPTADERRRAAYSRRLDMARRELDELLAGVDQLTAEGVPQH